ncbi:hypothetical protein [Pseudomonas sp. BC115LW]|uniref:hypothetical protein n=1 Tax=Pseudomonas sp. BC115LW TaxID=2683267 RepID=UPI001412E01F|nr:hypothetical protein [Pseudomonas sp. BC115LW]NBB33761.1 hypothetical protein [Pseudomonas sp. BC115LW]
MPIFHKREVVRLQLQTAVDIFLKKINYSAVITLAGACSGILGPLVIRAGKENFDEYARRLYGELSGQIPKRPSYSKHITQILGIIAHKHLSGDDTELIELDLEKLACDALIRAMADYSKLYGDSEPFVIAFFGWVWANVDGAKVMKDYLSTPKRIRPK